MPDLQFSWRATCIDTEKWKYSKWRVRYFWQSHCSDVQLCTWRWVIRMITLISFFGIHWITAALERGQDCSNHLIIMDYLLSIDFANFVFRSNFFSLLSFNVACALRSPQMAAIFPILDVPSCIATKWTRHMGFCVTYTALLMKTWR